MADENEVIVEGGEGEEVKKPQVEEEIAPESETAETPETPAAE